MPGDSVRKVGRSRGSSPGGGLASLGRKRLHDRFARSLRRRNSGQVLDQRLTTRRPRREHQRKSDGCPTIALLESTIKSLSAAGCFVEPPVEVCALSALCAI